MWKNVHNNMIIRLIAGQIIDNHAGAYVFISLTAVYRIARKKIQFY